MPYLVSIIAKVLAIVDGVMAPWTTTPTVIDSACGIGRINVALSGCGTDLVDGLAKLVVGGVALLANIVQALGAGSY